MKIGLILDDTLDSTDGVQQYVLLLGEWLTNNGHEVHYLVGSSSRTDIGNIHSLTTNIKVSFNKNKMTVPLPANSKKIQNLLKQEKFDILHVQMPFSPQLAGKIINLTPKTTAIIATFHIAPYSNKVKLATKALAKLQTKNIKKIDKIISVSTVAKNFAELTYNIKSEVMPNAIDLRKWQVQKPVKIRYDLVFVGRFVERKGCIYLLKALKYIKQNIDLKIKAAIVGDGPQKNKLKKYVKENQLTDICDFKGYVSESEKFEILQSSKVAVYPATGGESFGIVLLEAMAAGAIALAGNNPGYQTVLGSTSRAIFNPKDEETLAKLIVRTLTNNNLYNDLKRQQKIILQKYDINIVGSDILKIYESILKD